jgi:hypothetical protein
MQLLVVALVLVFQIQLEGLPLGILPTIFDVLHDCPEAVVTRPAPLVVLAEETFTFFDALGIEFPCVRDVGIG